MQSADYIIPKVKPTTSDFTVGRYDEYGQLPPDMLEAKFEETNTGDDEDLYDSYARNTLTNWGPDKNTFAYEEPRGGVNRRSGRLFLQYYGHRGESDDPAHPEMFMGYIDPGDWDPRGTATDPAMKKLAQQWDARMRFINFTPDDSDQITGGGRSESKVMADNQSVFKWIRDRMRWFTTQKDGPREGLRRSYPYCSDVNKTQHIQSYGDYIKDQALTPQRRSLILSDKILRDLAGYRNTCDQQDRNSLCHQYGQSGRRRAHRSDPDTVGAQTNDTEFSPQELTRIYRAASILMSQLIQSKRDMHARGDTDFDDVMAMQARKQQAMLKDLNILMRSIMPQNDFGEMARTLAFSTKSPENEHIMRLIATGHTLPAMVYADAALMYKSVKPGADMIRIKSEMITDTNKGITIDAMARKLARIDAISGGAGKDYSLAQTNTESTYTFNYKTKRPELDKKVTNSVLAGPLSESNHTQVRKKNHANYQVVDKAASDPDSAFYDNHYKDRRARAPGNKYLMRDQACETNTLIELS